MAVGTGTGGALNQTVYTPIGASATFSLAQSSTLLVEWGGELTVTNGGGGYDLDASLRLRIDNGAFLLQSAELRGGYQEPRLQASVSMLAIISLSAGNHQLDVMGRGISPNGSVANPWIKVTLFSTP